MEEKHSRKKAPETGKCTPYKGGYFLSGFPLRSGAFSPSANSTKPETGNTGKLELPFRLEAA